jgi:hypothetical protein
MTKKHFHEIICSNCDSSFWINDAYSYFNNKQVCSNCKSEIRSGNNGLNEQILIYIKRKASVRAIRMVKDARKCSMRAAKKQVKAVAKENNIKINTDVTPVLNFFLRIIISGLLGLAVVGIGSIWYPNLQKIAAPIVCQGEFKIEIVEKLTTKTEGERSKGAVIVATCDDEDISRETFYTSVGIYSLIIFILLTARRIFRK